MAEGDIEKFDVLRVDNWTPFERKIIPEEIKINDNCFSVLTYNILNDAFALRGGYQYVTKKFCLSETRNEYILKEIATWSPDLVCLQEVKRCLYETQLLPRMQIEGYEGVISDESAANVNNNLALFYKRDKFVLKSSDSYLLGDLIEKEILTDDVVKTEDHDKVIESVQSNCSALFAALEFTSGCHISVGTVHLPWDWFKNPGMKCLQIEASMRHLWRMSKTNPFIFLGDFNSRPNGPPYRYLTSGIMDKGLFENFIKEREELKVVKRFLNTGINLKSCYNIILGREPAVTSSSDDIDGMCADCLDYIWFWSSATSRHHLHLRGVLEVPSLTEVERHFSLPSPVFPSDHLPLLAHFEAESGI